MSAGKLHPIFEAALAPFTTALRTEPTPLSEELLDAVDGAEETRGRDSRLQRWAGMALRLELAQAERDEMAGALRDIIFGMQMQIDSGVWSGATLGLIKEVKRVATAGLREGSVS